MANLVLVEYIARNAVDRAAVAAEWTLAEPDRRELGGDVVRLHCHPFAKNHNHTLEVGLHVAGNLTEFLDSLGRAALGLTVLEPEGWSIANYNCSYWRSVPHKACTHFDRNRKMTEMAVEHIAVRNYSLKMTRLRRVVGDNRLVEDMMVARYQKRN